MLKQWLLIGLLFVSTYISRVIGVEVMARRQMSPTLRLYFNYVPVAIMAALIIKQIFVSVEGQLVISMPVLVGCLATAIVIKAMKMFLPAVVSGVIAGLLVYHFFG
ncbi:MAG: AzlD domain-containing protein [bacterium]|jgi:branched-subunit amino acid transport protein